MQEICYHFIINPNSRAGLGMQIWQETEKRLRQAGIPYEAHLTRSVGHTKKLAHKLSLTDHPRTIIALGGDGTINEVVNGLVLSPHITFGCIPTGSGNDFARGLGLASTPAAALSCILGEHRLIPLTLGTVTSDYKTHRFAVSAGIGFDAAVCHEALASPVKKLLNRFHLGKLSYLFIGLKQLLLWRPFPLTLYLPHGKKQVFQKTYFAAVMNLPYEGGGFRFCPRAKGEDLCLHLCIVADLPRWKALLLLALSLFGKHTHFRGVHLYRCRSAILHTATPQAVHRDGESGGFRSELIINLENHTLNVIGPVI